MGTLPTLEPREVVAILERVGFGAFVPDLPGCVATAGTEEEVRRLIQEAVELHVEDLREAGQPVPAPSHSVGYVDVLSTA